MRANIREMEKGLYLLDDAGESTGYLLVGEKGAALIDTMNGLEDLKQIVDSLTDLPVTVINTHGHCDHIGGNIFFEEAWLHPADEKLAYSHFAFMEEDFKKFGKTPCPFRMMALGQVFDLGGVTLEVVSLKGHTPGSVGLLCREKRLLFTGDGVNTHLWMQLADSTSIRELKETLEALQKNHGHAFDRILHGHARDYLPGSHLECLIAGCRELMESRREKDKEYVYFDGQAHALQHPYGPDGTAVIVYDESKL